MHWHKLYLYPTKLQNNEKCSPKFLASLAQEHRLLNTHLPVTTLSESVITAFAFFQIDHI